MKTFLAVSLLLLPPAARAQNTDIARLQSTCLPTAPLSTLRAVIQVESGGNPNAMQIDFPEGATQALEPPRGNITTQAPAHQPTRSVGLAGVLPELRHLCGPRADAGQHRRG